MPYDLTVTIQAFPIRSSTRGVTCHPLHSVIRPVVTPTAAVVFALFAPVMLVQFVVDNTTRLQGHGVQEHHRIICEAVGIDPAWYQGVATKQNSLPRTTPP